MKFALDEVLTHLPGPPSERWPDGQRFEVVLQRHGLVFELYAPRGHDPQQPHARDELYVVARGTARFARGAALEASVCDVAAGDALFVPAREPHRFESFSDDFAAWVVFFGPDIPPPA
jgi:mannose-6-phosphate isomerase-like protein (cupin superfamily)